MGSLAHSTGAELPFEIFSQRERGSIVVPLLKRARIVLEKSSETRYAGERTKKWRAETSAVAFQAAR